MIVGIGIDIVELPRIQRSLERFGMIFISRVLHASEQCELPKDILSPNAVAHVAARFAAKEATVKALGTGFAEGVCLQDVRVATLSSGQPVLSLHNAARARATLLGAANYHVSLTHEKGTAAAVVILETLS